MSARLEIVYTPFPGYTPKTNADGVVVGARYYLSSRGHVLRDRFGESTTMHVVWDIIVKPFARGKTLNVKLGGGAQTRSLPSAMATAFATNQPPDDNQQWSPIIVPGTPKDKVTGVTRCAIGDICWTPYSEVCHWTRSDIDPSTLYPIVDP